MENQKDMWRLADVARRATAWAEKLAKDEPVKPREFLEEGVALKTEALSVLEGISKLESQAKDFSQPAKASKAAIEENQAEISKEVIDLIYNGNLDAAHLWDILPKVGEMEPEISKMRSLKGSEVRMKAARCLACTACTACATCGLCALCIISGVAAAVGIGVTSTVSSTQSYGS